MRDKINCRIYKLYRRLDPWNIDRGRVWYQEAHDHAALLATKYGLTCEQASALIAVLSPGATWEQNLKDAVRVCEYQHDATVSTYSANKRKAVSILNNNYSFIQFVRGNKVRSFSDNIARPHISMSVTLDRHMLRYLLNTREDKELNKVFRSSKNYQAIAERVRKFAIKRGIKPLELQAMLWLQLRP